MGVFRGIGGTGQRISFTNIFTIAIHTPSNFYYWGTLVDEFIAALDLVRIEIKKYNEKLLKPLRTSKGNFNFETFTDYFREQLGRDSKKFPGLSEALYDDREMEKLLRAYAKDTGKWEGEPEAIVPPPGYADYVLNMDLSAKDTTFFITKDDVIVHSVSGNSYIKILQLPEDVAVAKSRRVVPQYLPRSPVGVSRRMCKDKTTQDVLNTYIPPTWATYQGKVSDCLPELFLKLVRHLIPLEVEQEFFFSWLHDSMFSRAPVYLVLSGAPGSGKNTLKGVMTALHGHSNTVDGKRTTLDSNFNGALEGNTLHWFDELEYGPNLEPRMKELPNRSVSIERKGIDSTGSSDIYCSFVITNNDPRNNYLAFDARKFAPLDIAKTDLLHAMTNEEIEELVQKVDERSPNFDIKFVAQIARWVKRRGRSKKWPHLAYKGPMFWKLANDSMFAWQKIIVRYLLTTPPGGRMVSDPSKGILFSSISPQIPKKMGNGGKVIVPDFAHVMPFLNLYRNLEGEKVFKTDKVPGDTMGDFWVKRVDKKQKQAEHEKSRERKKENYDL